MQIHIINRATVIANTAKPVFLCFFRAKIPNAIQIPTKKIIIISTAKEENIKLSHIYPI